MIHSFPKDVQELPLPEQFTYPFRYTPHPLCIAAAEEVQSYLQGRKDWHEELQNGKMFGVLIIRTTEGNIGYLAAFSGNLAGSNHHEFFVPPVYDLLHPDGYFKEEEARISAINRRIQAIALSPHSSEIYAKKLDEMEKNAQSDIERYKQFMKQSQQRRTELRTSGNLSDFELQELIKESQYQKAELKRKKDNWKSQLDEIHQLYQPYINNQNALKRERKERSMALQQWIFQQFQMRNAKGEIKDLWEIFHEHSNQIPPAGAGECAAPKLLQYAYLNGLQPIAMAEFWWGESPKGEIRRHGQFYPACKHKCEPILSFMLQGLDVEPNPLLQNHTDANLLEIIYEDDYLLVVNKPAGMLSVPGKSDQVSVHSIIQGKYPNATGPLLVHRLDMDTSGLLLIAKNKDTHALLQEQFETRKVKKRYIALLDGSPTIGLEKGYIHLPMRPDYYNTPFQVVDFEHGKIAVTRYEILNKEQHTTRIAYYPETGRTHQLRVHSAHPQGMNSPILGDPLYGRPSERMYLHAEELEFRHPHTNQKMNLKTEAPF
ncbi:MAG: RNA pseudouridine synthase [Bacteroides sp.]|nr:RNA pseudouridine synthase [Bacteroides sp.]